MIIHKFKTNIIETGNIREPNFNEDINFCCEIVNGYFEVRIADLDLNKLEEIKSKYEYLGFEEIENELVKTQIQID